MTASEPKIVGRECRFAVHIPSRKGLKDYHMVKELVHYSDGTTKNRLAWWPDFKRAFYITLPQYRAEHKQKKETESLDKLMKIECTQSDLKFEVARALGEHSYTKTLRELCNSPHIYGTEIMSTSLLKAKYQKHYPNFNTPFSVATLDIEADVINGTEDPNMASIVTNGKVYTVVLRDFLKRYSDPVQAVETRTEKYIGQHTNGKYECDLDIVDTPVQIFEKLFARLHEWSPDVVAIWNMNYDIPEILGCLKKYKVDPKTILCDPSVPMELRLCRYKPGQTKKKKSNGQETPVNVDEQWHTLYLTAGFYVLDAMCVYRLTRLHEPRLNSYKLDDILFKELGMRKLDFNEADGLVKLDWHKFMQKNYPAEYVVYNRWDSLSMFEMELKIKDLSSKFPLSAATTDFSKFRSLPTRITDAFHFYVEEKGHILASVGSEDVMSDYVEFVPGEEEEGEDSMNEVLGLRGWIMTLPAHLVKLGLKVILEDPNMATMIRAFVYDSDCISAYPTCISILNISKATTKRELIEIVGIPEEVFRMQNINLVCGASNAVEYVTTMHGMPHLRQLEAMYDTLVA